MKYICIPCGYLHEQQEDDGQIAWPQLPSQWQCPECGTLKCNFTELDLEAAEYDD